MSYFELWICHAKNCMVQILPLCLMEMTCLFLPEMRLQETLNNLTLNFILEDFQLLMKLFRKHKQYSQIDVCTRIENYWKKETATNEVRKLKLQRAPHVDIKAAVEHYLELFNVQEEEESYDKGFLQLQHLCFTSTKIDDEK